MQSAVSRRRALLDLLTLLCGAPDALLAQGVLADRSTDPGFFGPASVTWRVVREPLLLLSGGRALLMQVAHPLVSQGVIDHSQFEAEPFGRLLGTVRWVMEAVFGTTAEARRACAHLTLVHSRVHGRLASENRTAEFAASTAYDALDPELGLWVHATLVDSMLLGYETLICPLPGPLRDRFVREWNVVGGLLALPESRLWSTAAQLRTYIDGRIADGTVAPVAASRSAARTVLHPPIPWPGLSSGSAIIGFMTTGFLPSSLRFGYGLRWSVRHEQCFRRIGSMCRRLHPVLPRNLRVSPCFEIAWRRLRTARA